MSRRVLAGRLPVLFVALLAAACAGGQASTPAPGEVKVDVANVGLDQATGAHFVVLEDESHNRSLPILIGESEAQSIAIRLHGMKPPRPLTHDLLDSVIKQTGNRVDRVLIADLQNEIYFAKIYLDDGRYTIDSRPSDAIALAVRAGVPIYVSEKLFESSPTGGLRASLPRSARAFGVTVQQLTPELAGHFQTQAQSGLLIADVAKDAQKTGLKRGDVITRIGGRDVKGLDDFNQTFGTMTGHHAFVEITVRRDGSEQTIRFPIETAGEE
ncbi:MAG: bifunctional nuclease domain-containing protein [Candidatus Binataceae bacterium]